MQPLLFASTLTLRKPQNFYGRTAAAITASQCYHYRSIASYATSTNNKDTTLQKISNLNPIPPVQPIATGFHQPAPSLRHPFNTDYYLQSILMRLLPKEIFLEIKADLVSFGSRIQSEIQNLHTQCEDQKPFLTQYDAYGSRKDSLYTSSAWKKQKEIAAEEGLIAIGYERKYAEFSRIYQVAKLYLYSPSSGLYGCPLAMTDGAAKSIEVAGIPQYLSKAYIKLTSRDPKKFWTSGQWMTEKKGGSDVAHGTETLAYPQEDGSYKLHGYKWFSSATDADMSLTLARVVGPDGVVQDGTKGLSMFYVETRDSMNELNNIQMVRLKDKLGTRQLPTAELLLHGTKAHLVGEVGRGVATISDMLTVSRTYNTLFSSSVIRRMVSLCADYSTKRVAFGKPICKHPLHMKVLAEMELEAMSSALLTFELARLLGLEESKVATDRDKLLLRLLTPICKLYTAKQSVRSMSEGLEAIGGLGYLEDTGFPSMLRDAQVLPIWEGTTNILSLDMLRAVHKTNGEVLKAYISQCKEMISQCDPSQVVKLEHALHELSCIKNPEKLSELLTELRARELAYSLARVYVGCLMARHSMTHPDLQPLQAAFKRWCNQDLLPVLTNIEDEPDCQKTADENWQMVMYGLLD